MTTENVRENNLNIFFYESNFEHYHILYYSISFLNIKNQGKKRKEA